MIVYFNGSRFNGSNNFPLPTQREILCAFGNAIRRIFSQLITIVEPTIVFQFQWLKVSIDTILSITSTHSSLLFIKSHLNFDCIIWQSCRVWCQKKLLSARNLIELLRRKFSFSYFSRLIISPLDNFDLSLTSQGSIFHPGFYWWW